MNSIHARSIHQVVWFLMSWALRLQIRYDICIIYVCFINFYASFSVRVKVLFFIFIFYFLFSSLCLSFLILIMNIR